jgi:Holliday junction resolvasome RuvABC endonuclease subunit
MSGQSVLALDPGTTETGWALLSLDGRVESSGVLVNADMLERLRVHAINPGTRLAIEMIASYGMPVGREVFETCVWIGRFKQAWRAPDEVQLVYRQDVKLYLCGTPRAKDPNVRQALLDLLGPQGTKKAPGPTYGVKSHAWAALGVAVTAARVTEPLTQAKREELMRAF